MDDVSLKLPALIGDNIEEHFHNIAKQQVEPYQKLIRSIVDAKIPAMPEVSWAMKYVFAMAFNCWFEF